jgi:hypothetical protein
MKPHQDKAVWELCRQGLHGVAAEAEAAWSKGEGYRPPEPLPLARYLADLIRLANWESKCQAA